MIKSAVNMPEILTASELRSILLKRHDDLTEDDRATLLNLITQETAVPRRAARPVDRRQIRRLLLKREAKLSHGDVAVLGAFFGMVRIKLSLLESAEASPKAKTAVMGAAAQY